MAIPKYNELYQPILQTIQDGNVHGFKETQELVASTLALSEEELSERISSGLRTVFANRFGWAITYLKKAELILYPQRSHVQITAAGKALLDSGKAIDNRLLAEQCPAFAAFIRGKAQKDPPVVPAETPQETIEQMYRLLNDQLAEDLLSEIFRQSPYFFEKLVVDLMEAMGYGSGSKTPDSHDGGIDGIIYEDKLGFNLIYIQAKRWAADHTIGRPEIQQFVGVMAGPPKVEKGMYITTSKFSKEAREYAESQHIILIDGKQLASLMIEHGVGVSVQKTYSLKRIDSDYFADN